MYIDACRGFPVEQYRNDRLGLVLAFYGLGLVLGRPQVSQTDYTEDGQTFGVSRLRMLFILIHASEDVQPVWTPWAVALWSRVLCFP